MSEWWGLVFTMVPIVLTALAWVSGILVRRIRARRDGDSADRSTPH
jgi:hypothetical protein